MKYRGRIGPQFFIDLRTSVEIRMSQVKTQMGQFHAGLVCYVSGSPLSLPSSNSNIAFED